MQIEGGAIPSIRRVWLLLIFGQVTIILEDVMEQKSNTVAATVIAMIFLFIVYCVMTDTAYATNTLKTNIISEQENQSENIQNKTNLEDPIANKLYMFLPSSGQTIKTNLEDAFTMRTSKKIFDVWAKNGGTKIPVSATLFRVGTDGSLKKAEEINVAWDDGNKTSFILDMDNQASGSFKIKIWTGDSVEAANKIVERNFEYIKVPKGGYVGDITIDIEASKVAWKELMWLLLIPAKRKILKCFCVKIILI